MIVLSTHAVKACMFIAIGIMWSWAYVTNLPNNYSYNFIATLIHLYVYIMPIASLVYLYIGFSLAVGSADSFKALMGILYFVFGMLFAVLGYGSHLVLAKARNK